jgi:hypothetical protein
VEWVIGGEGRADGVGDGTGVLVLQDFKIIYIYMNLYLYEFIF